MGDLSKLRVAVGQPEIVEGHPSRNEAALDRLVDRALDQGADLLVAPGSLTDERDIRLIGLNDTRVDVAGSSVVLDACGETYRIGIGGDQPGCDFSLCADLAPYTVAGSEEPKGRAQIVLRPAGMQDKGKAILAHDGASSTFDAEGRCIARLRDDFAEDVQTFTMAEGGAVVPRCGEKLLKALVSTMRRFDALVLGGRHKWIIGLSGGLDSSVVAALLVLAYGSERVAGYNLATRFNSAATRDNAAMLSSRLNVSMRNGSIEDLVVSLGNTLVGYGYPADALRGVVLENAQARTRGNLLSTFAAVEGGVVVNNGNRVEGALGYATLYGDAIGALAPIGDLTKVQLFGLAREINDELGFEAIPENLLPTETERGYEWQTMPSAELSSGQRDPMKWFYHDWLISLLLDESGKPGATLDDVACDVMERYLETRLFDTEIAKWVRFYGLDDPAAFASDIDWVVSSMRASAFKRIQAPPTIALASTSSVQRAVEPQLAGEPSSRYRALSRKIKCL